MDNIKLTFGGHRFRQVASKKAPFQALFCFVGHFVDHF